MTTPAMPRFQPEDVRADLLYLRKGSGYTPQRLASRPALVSILDGGTNGTHEPQPVLKERLISAICSLHDEDATLLLEIFNLDPPTTNTTLAARRSAAGHRLGIGREAVADRDSAAIERLLRQLLTGWYPKSPAGIRIPEHHNGFVQHAVHVSTFVRDRRHLESIQRYRLFALFDDVAYVTMVMSYPEAPIPLGPYWQVRSQQLSEGWQHQFWHHTPMRRGHTYDLAFRICNPDPQEPYWLTEESLAFHEPTRFVRFDVTFLGPQPHHAWAFHGLTALERPGTPDDPHTRILTPTSHNTITADFHDAYGGLYCGVAWEW